jgi:hypothetical protein
MNSQSLDPGSKAVEKAGKRIPRFPRDDNRTDAHESRTKRPEFLDCHAAVKISAVN